MGSPMKSRLVSRPICMYRTQVVWLEADALYAFEGGGFGEEVGISLWIVLQGDCQKDRSQRR